jgi:CheY-like chemotaxis protein
MKAPPAAARVLIATDNAKEGLQVQRLLEDHFEHFSVSTDPASSVRDFEDFRPDVVVLAFDTIAKAQGYCLGLYRFGPPELHQHPHRTILLCSKSEVSMAFELCKKQNFDDYVLHWPLAQDGKRLPMSVWIASREIIAARAAVPVRTGLQSHARQVKDLETALDHEFSVATHKLGEVHAGLDRLDQELSSASDEFSQRLTQGAGGAVEVKDPDALLREIESLKSRHAAQTHNLREQTLAPVMSWARNLPGKVEPALAGARELAETVRGARPVIMVVDDDEMSREELVHALDATIYDIVFAGDSTAALNQLRRMRPDAILMASRLPGLDGVSFTRHLKAAPQLAGIPIIMLTGDSRRETLLSSLEAGAAAFVVKPFTRESLNSKLSKVLSNYA